jgi:hypothetical protein
MRDAYATFEGPLSYPRDLPQRASLDSGRQEPEGWAKQICHRICKTGQEVLQSQKEAHPLVQPPSRGVVMQEEFVMGSNARAGMPPDDCAKLNPSFFSAGAGFVRFMKAIPGKYGIGRDERTEMSGAQEPLPIEAVVQAFIERADHLPRFARPEDTRLIQKINDLQEFLAERYRSPEFRSRCSVSEHFAASVENDGFAQALLQQSCDGRKRIRQMHVIAVQPAQDISGRSPEPFIDGRRLTGILFGTPETEFRVMVLQNFDGVIRATSIEHQELEIRIRLVEHTPERLLDELALIK